MWNQIYDPLGNTVLSTLAAAIPVVVLLSAIAFFHVKAHWAALLGLASALLVATLGFGMPVQLAGMAAVYGAGYGLLPIGWLVLSIIFLYQLTNDAGEFDVLKRSISAISDDRRLQLLFIAFSFGAFFEGAAGFGTPVAVTAAMLIGLGFAPLAASGLSLIANTAPVAFGALGAPMIGLSAVTGLDILQLSAMVGRQLPFFSLIVPFWLIWAFVGFRKMIEIWPAILVSGVSFAIPQFLVSNFHGPWLVDVIAALVSMACLAGFLRIWKPATVMTEMPEKFGRGKATAMTGPAPTAAQVRRAWMPWVILSVFVFAWGTPQVKAFLDSLYIGKFPVAMLDKMVMKVPPVVAKPVAEGAVYTFNILSAAGTGIMISAIISGLIMGYGFGTMGRTFIRTIGMLRYSLMTIACMLAIGYVTRFGGSDATLGLAMAKTGWLYPLFGTLIGWMGVALTGSDTASNVLFGGLQKITSEQLGLNPILMAAANSSGGVMGKMIDAQSIVVASTATKWYGNEGQILRFVFFHSLALAVLVGILVMGQAYVPPFTSLVVH